MSIRRINHIPAHALDSHQKTINMYQQTMDSHQKVMDSHQKVTWYTDDSIRTIEHGMPSTIVLESKTRLIARLIIGADGGNSKVRQLASIGTQGWQYRQQALGVNIKTDSIQQDITSIRRINHIPDLFNGVLLAVSRRFPHIQEYDPIASFCPKGN
jgi:2-polyprenyl-6-methoxyphenol hydroxylase-like FAD-dependent oxidoreductase